MKNQKGITLIALVVTIVVLLILAGVSIAMLTGDNGLITNAQNAKYGNKEGEVIDKMQLAYSAVRARIMTKVALDDSYDATADITKPADATKDTSLSAMIKEDLPSAAGYTIETGTGTITMKYSDSDFSDANADYSPIEMEITITAHDAELGSYTRQVK